MARSRSKELGELIGVPFLPPPWLARIGKRAYSTIHRLRSNSIPPPAQIMESLFGILDHQGLVLLCGYGVIDALEEPTTAEALAHQLDLDPERLELFLRLGVARGWLAIDRDGRFKPNRVTTFLRADHPGGWRSQVELLSGPELIDSIRGLSLRAGSVHVFDEVHGVTFQEYLAAHPDRWEVFDRQQAVGGRVHGFTLARGWDWKGVDTVCDVGGGTGALLGTLIDLQPHLRGTLFDLPTVVSRAAPHDRVEIVGGDAFDGVPVAHDVYLLVNIVHMWSDDDATAILRQVAAAAKPHSSIVIVESLRDDVPRADMTPYLDVLMAALTDGGVERGPEAMDLLARSAGLRLVSTSTLGTGDLAHDLRLPD